MTHENPLPRSIAIAGAWGYIGRRFLDVALEHGLDVTVFDPGPTPPDVDPARLRIVPDIETFSNIDADVFHLATHPEFRRLDLLLARPSPALVLNEKPMAVPGRPEECRSIVEAIDRSGATVLYDFPELFDPITARVVEWLGQAERLEVEHIYVQRSKDREDPANSRNNKRMVTIQYQETVHCLAWCLHILASLKGGLPTTLAQGVKIEGESRPYTPPNPELYPEPVDGRVTYHAELAGVPIEGLTDFTRGAPWSKRRIVRGRRDGIPFVIDASYLEGDKWLRIDGQAEPIDPRNNSYEHVLRSLWVWARSASREELHSGPYPHARFALATYRFSAALHHACQTGRAVVVAI